MDTSAQLVQSIGPETTQFIHFPLSRTTKPVTNIKDSHN